MDPLFDSGNLPKEIITYTNSLELGDEGLEEPDKVRVSMWYLDEETEPLVIDIHPAQLKPFLAGISFALQYFTSKPEEVTDSSDRPEGANIPSNAPPPIRPRHIEEPIPEDDIPF